MKISLSIPRIKTFFTIISLFLLIVGIHSSLWAQDFPPLETLTREDHVSCIEEGYFLSGFDDPVTSKYYFCRAEKIKRHLLTPSSLQHRLTPHQEGFNQKIYRLHQEFLQKATMIEQQFALKQSPAAWEDLQSERAKKYDLSDHKACLDKGFFPLSWANPSTEKYYLCRAALIDQRAETEENISATYEKRTPKAALYFLELAKEASYAFRATDYASHHECLQKGFELLAPENPKTEAYYHCRTEIAKKTTKDPALVKMFAKKAEESHHIALHHQACTARNIEKDSSFYPKCIKIMHHYESCLKKQKPLLPPTASAKDLQECQMKALQLFPDALLSKRKKHIMTLDKYNHTTSTIIEDTAIYSLEELKKVRDASVNICLTERKTLRSQHDLDLRKSCESILTPLEKITASKF